jgi:hypothetical protein
MFPYSWILGGGLLAIIAVGTGMYVKGSHDGATHARYACELRVALLQKAITDQNKHLETAVEGWRLRLEHVEEDNNAQAVQREKEFAEMEARFKAYTSTLGVQPQCIVDHNDAQRLH